MFSISIYITFDDNQVVISSLTPAISTAWILRLRGMLGLILAFDICPELIEKVKGKQYPNGLPCITGPFVGKRILV
jgi:hypothetical protein